MYILHIERYLYLYVKYLFKKIKILNKSFKKEKKNLTNFFYPYKNLYLSFMKKELGTKVI